MSCCSCNKMSRPRATNRIQSRTMRPHLAALIVCTTIILLNQTSQLAQATYDPEQQDGIPVFSARSIARPLDDWNADQVTAPNHQSAQQAQRRQADSDLDDGLEDEDEDEYKSGSSPQESVENPSYGESVKSARDGDEIEDFFDKHLGPPQEATAPEESQASISRQEVPAADPDTDDHYETAASSPLSNIFHSLLSHTHGDHKHKRPLLQIATTGSDSDSPTNSANSNKDENSSSGSMKTSQSAPGVVETAPIALAFTPIAAPSQMVAQDPSGQEAPDQQEAGPPASGIREIYIGRRPTVMSYLQQSYQQQQQQQQAQPLPGYTTAGSSHVWRGAPNRQQAMYQQDQQDQQSDYARYPIAASYAYQREQPNVAASAASPSGGEDDTVTYGLSFGGSPSADEGSGGSQPSEGAQDEQASGSAEEQQDQQPYQQQGYAPYNTRYSTSSTRAYNNYYNQPVQYASGPYYRQGYARATPQQQQQQQQMIMQQQQANYQPYSRAGSTRYHRDPSESMTSAMQSGIMQPHPQQQQQQQYYAGYQQVSPTPHYRGSKGNRKKESDDEPDETRIKAQQIAERQQLLASLDREIKASPQYRNNNAAAAASSRMFATQGPVGRPGGDNRQRLVAIKTVKKTYKGDDLDSFNSFHSEVDPYKTFTSTSRMVDDPTSQLISSYRQAPIQSGSDRVPATDSTYDALNNAANMANASNSNTDLNQQQQQVNTNLLTGPLTHFDQPNRNGDLQADNRSRNGNADQAREPEQGSGMNKRVRREDSDEREIDNDVDDDGVWVDDDEDDDNKQQSSDVNETAQDPESEEEEDNGQQDEANNVPVTHHRMNPPGVIGGPHGYELSPNDLMIYHG